MKKGQPDLVAQQLVGRPWGGVCVESYDKEWVVISPGGGNARGC